MSLLYWIVFGLITGSIADFLSPNVQGGILGSIFLGILGAVVGGYLGEKFFGVEGVTGFNVRSFVVAVLGALFVLFISRLLMRG
jgi:uncharacterized membrane protein YeaQ/YmgE (transglycosylase-associated protein family)